MSLVDGSAIDRRFCLIGNPKMPWDYVSKTAELAEYSNSTFVRTDRHCLLVRVFVGHVATVRR